MFPNITTLLGVSLIPFVLGYFWFHPKVFGGENWYDMAKLHGKDRSNVSTIKLLSTLILNFLIAFGLYSLVYHQFALFNIVGADVEILKSGVAAEFLNEYGSNYRSFGHGVFHGIFPATILYVIPILGYVTIFEKKSLKYFFVYLGYWSISLAIMGGVLCQWGPQPL